MAEASLAKVEDRIAAALRGHPALAGTTVLTDHPTDTAVEDDKLPALMIYTVAYDVDPSDEYGAQTLHAATIELVSITKGPALVIGRANHAALAHAIVAIRPDAVLADMLNSLTERDIMPTEGNRRDAGSVSLQVVAQWFTPRTDWFTILGQGGTEY